MKIIRNFILVVLLVSRTGVAFAQYTEQDILMYIETYKELAINKMYEYKIPASITIAQGIFESACGKSHLAVDGNNHFGIKCHKGWEGDTILIDDDELQECFRKYTSVEESFNDHSNFLKTRQRYASLFSLDVMDYPGWARGLKAAGYATNPEYANRLISLIERFHIARLDTFYQQRLESGYFANYPDVHPELLSEEPFVKGTAVSTVQPSAPAAVSQQPAAVEKGPEPVNKAPKNNKNRKPKPVKSQAAKHHSSDDGGKSQPAPKPQSQPQAQPQPAPKPQPAAQSKSQSQAQPKPQTKPQPQPAPKPQPAAQPQSQSQAQPKPQTKPQPQPQPAPKPQPVAQPQSQPAQPQAPQNNAPQADPASEVAIVDDPPTAQSVFALDPRNCKELKDYPFTERQVYTLNKVLFVLAEPGDTYSKIAADVQVSEKNLKSFNDVSGPAKLKVGQVVYIERKRPCGERPVYTVENTETLWYISQKCGIRLKKLCDMNGLSPSSQLKKGRNLRLK
ncbi:MAG: glucosaminidase domain-containing protein [Bacteroidales bacterium]|nr:glucosaminidase domain-containing protein [Bacteroidales bacterium]